jgi:hypothetical protein
MTKPHSKDLCTRCGVAAVGAGGAAARWHNSSASWAGRAIRASRTSATGGSGAPPRHSGVARKRLESARTGGRNAATRLDKASAPAMRRKTV